MFESIYNNLYSGRIDLGTIIIKTEEIYSILPKNKMLEISTKKGTFLIKLSESAEKIIQKIREDIDMEIGVIDISKWVVSIV